MLDHYQMYRNDKQQGKLLKSIYFLDITVSLSDCVSVLVYGYNFSFLYKVRIDINHQVTSRKVPYVTCQTRPQTSSRRNT